MRCRLLLLPRLTRALSSRTMAHIARERARAGRPTRRTAGWCARTAIAGKAVGNRVRARCKRGPARRQSSVFADAPGLTRSGDSGRAPRPDALQTRGGPWPGRSCHPIGLPPASTFSFVNTREPRVISLGTLSPRRIFRAASIASAPPVGYWKVAARMPSFT